MQPGKVEFGKGIFISPLVGLERYLEDIVAEPGSFGSRIETTTECVFVIM